MFGELLFSFDSLKLGISYKVKKTPPQKGRSHVRGTTQIPGIAGLSELLNAQTRLLLQHRISILHSEKKLRWESQNISERKEACSR